MKFKRPPLTNEEARILAQQTLANLDQAQQNLIRLGRVLNYIHPLATPEQQERMKEILNEEIHTGTGNGTTDLAPEGPDHTEAPQEATHPEGND